MLFLVTRRCLQGPHPSPRFTSPTYDAASQKLSRFQKRRHRFQAYSLPRKCVATVNLGLKAIGAFVLICCAVHLIQGPIIFRSFLPSVDHDYLLEQWDEVEPTLKEGDIILMRGRGLMSWAIGTAQYGLSRLMHASAFRYSHVAVVVAPVQYHAKSSAARSKSDGERRRWWQRGSSGNARSSSSSRMTVAETLRTEEAEAAAQRTIARGALILEAMDNGEYHVPDVDGVTRYDQVQLVEAAKRIFSQSANGEPAYYYFSVRRLHPCGLTRVNEAERIASTEPVAMPETDLHGRPSRGDGPTTAVSTADSSSGTPTTGTAAPHSPSPYIVLNDRDLTACCSGASLDPVAAMHHFVSDNIGRPMDPSPLYVLSFMSPALYNWLRPSRDASREVSCSELIIELYQRMGLIQRHWRWEPLSATEEQQVANIAAGVPKPSASDPRARDLEATCQLLTESRKSSDSSEEAVTATPTSTTDTATSTTANTIISLPRKVGPQVWEHLYCRAELLGDRRSEWRLPLVKADETVEGPRELVSGAAEALLCAPARGVACTISVDRVLSGHGVGTLTRTSFVAGSQLASADSAVSADAQLLHAGLVRADATGKLHQLRWYYKHMSLQTAPYQFTEAGERRVLDWRRPFKLGHEEFVEMPPQRFTFKDLRTKT